MSSFRYWQGRLRLRHGYCPECNSSPPRDDCKICHGVRPYGPLLEPGAAIRLRRLWERERRRA